MFATFFLAAELSHWFVAAPGLLSVLCAGRAGTRGKLWYCTPLSIWPPGGVVSSKDNQAALYCHGPFCCNWIYLNLCQRLGIAVTGTFARQIGAVSNFRLNSLLNWQHTLPMISSESLSVIIATHPKQSVLNKLILIQLQVCNTTELMPFWLALMAPVPESSRWLVPKTHWWRKP